VKTSDRARALGLPAPPWATLVAAALILAVFAAELVRGVDAWRPGALDLAALGGDPDAGLGWRLVLAPLVHLGALHLAFNLISIALVGPPLERAVGAATAAIALVGGAVAGAALHVAMQPYDLAVGASGASFGAAAALAIIALRRRDGAAARRLAAFAALEVAAAIAAAAGAVSVPDGWSHLGGGAAGVLVALVAGPRKAPLRSMAAAIAVAIGAIALVALARPAVDWRADFTRTAALEARFDALLPDTITGAQPELAARLDTEVVTPLAALRDGLRDDPRMPDAIARRRAALRAYLDARLRALRAAERFLATGDAGARAELDAAQRDADRALASPPAE
jgi:membrane associated rhomboid family serine protease